jgi:hypothetical protein
MISIPWTHKPPLGVTIDWHNPLTSGLQFCAGLNESSGSPVDLVTSTQSSKNNNPTWQSCTVRCAAGPDSFDFASRDAPYIANPGNISIAVRFKIDSYANYNAPITKCTGNGPSGLFDMYTATSSGIFNIYRAGGVTHNTTAPQIPVNTWITLIVVFRSLDEGVKPDIFYNGVSQTTTLVAGTGGNYIVTGNAPIMIGRRPLTTKLLGNVDFAMIWNRSLSLSEVSSFNSNPWQLYQPQLIPFLSQSSATIAMWCKVAGSLKAAESMWIKTGGNLKLVEALNAKVGGAIK